MTKEQQALLDTVRSFKPEGITDIEALLNIVTNHASQIKTLTDRVKHLEKVLDQISESANKKQLF